MPLQISVGLSKKTSENYNSQGASISITAELDQTLLTRPHELQGAVSELYEQAESALDRQANGSEKKDAQPRIDHTRSNGSNGNGQANGRGGNGRTSRSSGRGMTESQRKAIFAIGEKLSVDPADEARHEFGVELDRASISEASKVIDRLKSLQSSSTQGSRR